MKEKYHIIVSRHNKPAIHIYTETEEEKNFVWTLLNYAMSDKNNYSDIIAISNN